MWQWGDISPTCYTVWRDGPPRVLKPAGRGCLRIFHLAGAHMSNGTPRKYARVFVSARNWFGRPPLPPFPPSLCLSVNQPLHSSRSRTSHSHTPTQLDLDPYLQRSHSRPQRHADQNSSPRTPPRTCSSTHAALLLHAAPPSLSQHRPAPLAQGFCPTLAPPAQSARAKGSGARSQLGHSTTDMRTHTRDALFPLSDVRSQTRATPSTSLAPPRLTTNSIGTLSATAHEPRLFCLLTFDCAPPSVCA